MNNKTKCVKIKKKNTLYNYERFSILFCSRTPSTAVRTPNLSIRPFSHMIDKKS